jgi:hypothetical protein
MLIDDPKYSWLKDLGLGATNNGAFYGVWGGTGEVTGQNGIVYEREPAKRYFKVSLFHDCLFSEHLL